MGESMPQADTHRRTEGTRARQRKRVLPPVNPDTKPRRVPASGNGSARVRSIACSWATGPGPTPCRWRLGVSRVRVAAPREWGEVWRPGQGDVGEGNSPTPWSCALDLRWWELRDWSHGEGWRRRRPLGRYSADSSRLLVA